MTTDPWRQLSRLIATDAVSRESAGLISNLQSRLPNHTTRVWPSTTTVTEESPNRSDKLAWHKHLTDLGFKRTGEGQVRSGLSDMVGAHHHRVNYEHPHGHWAHIGTSTYPDRTVYRVNAGINDRKQRAPPTISRGHKGIVHNLESSPGVTGVRPSMGSEPANANTRIHRVK